MNCPTCPTSLRTVTERGVEIDVCDACHGVWLDAGELVAVVGADRADHLIHHMPSAGARTDLVCPRCTTRDFVATHANVGSIARCSNCGGVFIDGDTLDSIAIDDREIVPELNGACKTALGVTWGLGDLFNWLSMFFSW